MTIFEIINALRNTSSRLEKERILKENEDNFILKDVLWYAYNPYVNFFIKKIPEYKTGTEQYTLTYVINFGLLDELKDRKVTGHAAIEYLINILSSLSKENAEVVKLIIKKDLDCGISYATINKVWPKLIPEFKVMKCHDNIEHIKFPCFGQYKVDGARTNVECLSEDGDYICYSSSGRSFYIGDSFKEYVKKFMDKGEIFDGELVCFYDNKPMDRKKSNGIILKAIRGTITDKECELINFIAWDVLPFLEGDDHVYGTYEKRFKNLLDRFYFDPFKPYIEAQNFIRIKLIHSKIINNEQEAWKFFDIAVENGEEGIILKNFDGLWEPKRVKHQGKMKEEYECDLEVVDYTLHSKDKSLIGNIICQTSCGKRFNVGSGLNDDLNKLNEFEVKLLNKIVTIRFNQLITNKKDNEIDLYLQRLIEVRFDKSEPNSMEDIFEIIKTKKERK